MKKINIFLFSAVLIGLSMALPQLALADTVTLRPNSDGDVTNFDIGGTTVALTNWESVDEEISDDDVTYVEEPGNSYKHDLYGLPDVSLSGSINSVTVYINCKAGPTPSQPSAYTMIKTGAVEYNGTEITLTTSYVTYSTTYTTNPQTTIEWTWTEVNALQAGLGMQKASNAQPKISICTQVWVVVDYNPAVTFTNGLNIAPTYEQTSPSPPENNWHFGQFSLATDGTGATLNSVAIMLGGTYDDGDLVSDPLPLRLYASNTNDFGTALVIGSDVADPGSGSDVIFSSLSDVIPSGTRYYWVTADISGTATGDDNINGTIDVSGDLSITGGTLNGSSNYGKLNAGSDASLPVELSIFTAQFLNGVPTLYWKTESETDNIGWFIYRNTEEEFDSAVRINNSLIPGYGTTTEPHDYIYKDIELDAIPGKTYWYWIQSVDFGGWLHLQAPKSVLIPDNIPGHNIPTIPILYGLHQNKPNPLCIGRGSTKISFVLPKTSMAEVKIYNIRGELVKDLYNDIAYGDDEVKITWDGRDENGTLQSAGIYLYQLKVNGKTYEVKRLIILR